MGADLLSIGQSGLLAAQVGLATTGHNISNANVDGYSRQRVEQASAQAQNYGYGFVGNGTYIAAIRRYSDDFLTAQVRTAQASKSALDAFSAQISQVDNLLADTTSGLSPALQDFFKGVQDVSSNPASVASRQALVSTANSLAARFQGLNGRLDEIRQGVDAQIVSNVTVINSLATQIADLNSKIGVLNNDSDQKPNDLLDQRDKLIEDLNKQVKTQVFPGDNGSLTVSIGTGQPLVVGVKAFSLQAIPSATDLTRIEVGYVTGNKVNALAENTLTGGEIGALFDFRANMLDQTQNSLGRIAVGLAVTYNDQHKLGQDENGQLGTDFFTAAPAVVGQSVNNNALSTTQVSATVVDATRLSGSDYKLAYDGNNFKVTRLSDNQQTLINPYPQAVPQIIDGVAFNISGNAAAGDEFLVRPTINGAAQFSVLLTDRSKIAAAAPIVTDAPVTNKGTGTISEGSVDANYLNNVLGAPVNLTYASATNTVSGFPAGQAVTVTTNGVATLYPAPAGNVPYALNSTYTFGGINFSFGGAPVNGDTFSIGPNISGVGDNRNARLLGALQSKVVFDNGTATYQSAYAQLVSFIGNKARETQVNGQSADQLLEQSVKAQQSVSGVNLDEEAANLLRYQQAYQAAGKVMQMASQLFDTLLSIGHA
ncbi:MAG: flagellar hook-associated protein FlgK [Pseudomonadota bacterium]